MKTRNKLILFLLFIGFTSCIQEDIVNDEIEETIRINNSFSSFVVGNEATLDAFFFDNLGIKQEVTFDLATNNSSVIEVDNNTKKIIAKSKGTATITISTTYQGKLVENSTAITVIESGDTPTNNVKVGTIMKTSSYVSAGDFEITEISGGIRITFASNYMADSSLPGYAMYLSNNPNTLEGARIIDAQGDADGVIYKGAFTLDVMGVGINDFGYLTHWCVPFKIKVGEAVIKNK
ncbi:hypothetical protein [Flavobacterium faecale]|uniref:hypothetical protein n=1 Tax=Flavobacterium faecale TaxID=1355330 RepID=UPI003AB05C06